MDNGKIQNVFRQKFLNNLAFKQVIERIFPKWNLESHQISLNISF